MDFSRRGGLILARLSGNWNLWKPTHDGVHVRQMDSWFWDRISHYQYADFSRYLPAPSNLPTSTFFSIEARLSTGLTIAETDLSTLFILSHRCGPGFGYGSIRLHECPIRTNCGSCAATARVVWWVQWSVPFPNVSVRRWNIIWLRLLRRALPFAHMWV